MFVVSFVDAREYPMTFLKSVPLSHLRVVYRKNVYPLTDCQLYIILRYRLGLKYNQKYLRNVDRKPYFQGAAWGGDPRHRYELYKFVV